MPEPTHIPSVQEFWDREGLGQAIQTALAASGIPLERLTIDDLAPLDQFHGGGKAATTRLAVLGGLAPGMRVLDVGGGLGGPARTLAVEYGCRVTVVDLTESYVQAGAALTALLGLGDRVSHRVGSALELPFEDEAFDVVWTQNSGMNIAAKAQMYAGFRRVLPPGGSLVLQEPMAGPVQPPLYPLMWADDAATNFLRTPAAMRTLIEQAGFRLRAWEDATAETSGGSAPARGPSIQSLVMGDKLATIAANGRRNRDEARIVMVQAVFDRA